MQTLLSGDPGWCSRIRSSSSTPAWVREGRSSDRTSKRVVCAHTSKRAVCVHPSKREGSSADIIERRRREHRGNYITQEKAWFASAGGVTRRHYQRWSMWLLRWSGPLYHSPMAQSTRRARAARTRGVPCSPTPCAGSSTSAARGRPFPARRRVADIRFAGIHMRNDSAK